MAIYLPLSRLLNLYVRASQQLFLVTERFLGRDGGQDALHHRHRRQRRSRQEHDGAYPAAASRSLVSPSQGGSRDTDGFLLPNAVLEKEGIMNRKDFRRAMTSRSFCAS